MRKPNLLELDNHGKVRRIIANYACAQTLARYDEGVSAMIRPWYDLAATHLSLARRLLGTPRAWRAVVSRAYYAAYNASRAVRFRVQGCLIEGAEDHKRVGDLPDDFPAKHEWSSWLWELRSDRSVSDYEPWPDAYRALSHRPAEHVSRVGEFLAVVREYLGERGVQI